MTIVQADASELAALVARLEAVTAVLQAGGALPDTPTQQAGANPDGTPANVAAGELIEAAWGNATANTIKTYKPRWDSLWTAYATRLQAWIAYYSTDAAGFARIPFPAAFGGTVVAVSMIDADPTTAGPHLYTTRETAADAFWCFTYRHDGVPHANSSLAARVIAVGPR